MTSNEPRLLLLIADQGPGAQRLRRIPVAMVARGFKGKQKFSVTTEDLAQIVQNFRKRGNGDLVIDYDHSTEFAAGSGDPVPAAGWLKQVDDAPDSNGVLYGRAEFTERAAKMLAAREYKYVSPVIAWGARSKDTGEPQGTTLTSLAITNSPLLERLPAIAFSEAGWQVECAQERGDGVPTIESAKDELKALAEQYFAEIMRLMDGGLDHMDAVMQTSRDHPEWPKREQQLRHILRAAKENEETMEKLTASECKSMLDRLEAEIDTKTRAKMGTGHLQYHQAMKLVASENPELDRKRTILQRAMWGG